jgi:peptidoglycan-associated lipoprotein
MRLRLLALVLVAATLLLVPGCARKRPATAERMPDEAEVPTAPVPEASNGGTLGPVEDPLAGDFDAVNRYVRSQGLLDDVYYAYDSSALSAAARQRLADNARFLTGQPQFEVMIEGHCDERGTPEYNLALGERRASAARDYLVSLGVESSRLRTLSYGEERPTCTESEESCWSRNRRSHFVIVGRRSVG